MADVILSKPSSGQTSLVNCEADSCFVLDFLTEESIVSLQQNDLVFSFKDGSQVRLVDFAAAYTPETMPTFVIANVGMQVEGRALWEALHESPDLCPGNELMHIAAADVSYGSVPGPEALPDMAQPDDPSVLSSMIMMQTTGV